MMAGSRGAWSLETILLFACVAAVFIGAAILAYRSGTKRAAMFENFAHTRGWTFSRSDSGEIRAHLERLFPDFTFSPGNIITVESGTRSLVVAECGFNYRTRRRGGMFGTFALVVSPAFSSVPSRFEIADRSRANELTLADQVKTGNPAFDDGYILTTREPEAATETIRGAVGSVLSHYLHTPDRLKQIWVAIDNSGAAVMTPALLTTEQLPPLSDLARQIEEAIR